MDYKEYREKWEEYPKNFIQTEVPLHLDLEITTRCNYDCVMCARNVEHTKSMDMDFELAKKIITEFGLKGGCAIKFCYLGEPCLYSHLVYLVRISKEKGVIDVRVSTNGSVLTPRLSEDLLRAGVDLMIFSIDSINPQTYKDIRVNGNLGRVVRNLAVFKHLRDKMKASAKIQVQVIPMPQNRVEVALKHYHEFFQEFADIVWESPWCKDFGNVYTDEKPQPNFFCQAPFRRLLVRVNGDIWLCCGDPLKEKFIANYNDMNLEEVWNGDYMKDVRKKLNEGKVHEIDACSKCSERYYIK